MMLGPMALAWFRSGRRMDALAGISSRFTDGLLPWPVAARTPAVPSPNRANMGD